MAGIGFKLQRMAEGRSLTGQTSAYVYSIFLVAGPWIFMVLAIAGMGYATCPDNRCVDLQAFRSIVIYNFCFSLLIAGPIALPITRYVSDQIYAKNDDHMAGAFATALALFLIAATLIVGPFYLFVAELPVAHRLAAFQNVLLCGAAWVLVPFVGALRDHRAASFAFVFGAAAMIAAAVFMVERGNPSSIDLLDAFNLGLAVIVGGLAWRLSREYGTQLRLNGGLARAFIRYWELAAIGFLYYAGGWIDKIIMWFAAPTGTLEIGGVFRTMPDYDAVMFWAQMTTIPFLAVFFIHIETNFYRIYRRFYDSFRLHASRREIEERMAALSSFVLRNVFGLFAAGLVITIASMLASFIAIEAIGLRTNQMGMLRAGLLGVGFHTGAVFCLIFLLYFDLRKYALVVTLVYAVLNGALTLGLLPLGFTYYGYGQMVAAAITFVVAVAILARELRWLHFHAFITNNVSVRGQASGFRFSSWAKKVLKT